MEFKFYLDDLEIEEPIGWDTSELSIKRDMEKYHGLFFAYTTDLEFIGDAYFKLKTLFDNYGFDAQCIARITMSCNGGEYEEVFTGKLNFASYRRGISDKCSISMEIAESTDEINIVNRQDIDVALDTTASLDGVAIPTVTLFDLLMHNYTLFYQGRWFSGVSRTSLHSESLVYGTSGFWQLRNPLCIAFNEIGGMSECSTAGDYQSSPDAIALAALVTIFTAPRTSTYTITYRISGVFTDNAPVSREGTRSLFFGKYDGVSVTSIFELESPTFYSTGVANYTHNYDYSGSFSVSINAGDDILFRCSVANRTITTGAPASPFTHTLSLQLDDDNYISIGEQSTVAATNARSSKIYDAFWKSIAYYTGNTDAFYSLLLGYPSAPDRTYVGNGCASYTALTNGYMIRGFLESDKPIIANLSDLFDAVDSIFNIGLGFELMPDGVKRCRVEQKSYFYDNLLLLGYFDDVRQYSESIEENLCYNTFELGFDDYKVEQGTDKLNTNDEFLTKYQWATVANSVKNKFTRMCKYISSLYPIETTRRNRFINNGSKESKFDENNFLIAMNRSGSNSCEKNENFTTVSGVNSPSEAYNLRFNLFSTLIRWSNILQSNVSRLYEKTIKYQSGSVNTSLELEYSDTCNGAYNDVLFSVKQDLPLTDVNNEDNLPLYEPIVYEFDYPMSWKQYNDFKRYPQGMVVFGRSPRTLIAAFIYDITYKPVLGMATYKLLRSYNQDLVNLFIIPPDLTLLEMGAIIMYKGLMSNFDTSGLGLGVWSDWAICNGNNGTEDLGGYSVKGYKVDDANYSTPYSTHGEDRVTLTGQESGVQNHSHGVGGDNGNLIRETGAFQVINDEGGLSLQGGASITINGSGNITAAESHENRPRGKAVVFIEKIR
jgi:hypothetical protein